MLNLLSLETDLITSFFGGKEVNQIFCLLCCSMLLGAGIGLVVYADSVSSAISCDGAIWASSSIIGETQTYAASLFTTDLAVMFKDLNVRDDNIRAVTNINSTGPVGVDEYSEQISNTTDDPMKCVFVPEKNSSLRMDRIDYSGLLKRGTYDSTRTINRDTSSKTMVNGTGMMLSRAESRDKNKTGTHSSDVSGNMSISEIIMLGGIEL